MVETRSGRSTVGERRSGGRALLLVSVLVALVGISTSAVFFDHVQHKAHSIYERGLYTFGGGETNKYWQAIPSWDEVKASAAAKTNQALPEPTVWEKTKAFVLHKDVRQVQAEAAYAAGKSKAADATEYAKSFGQDASARASQAYDATADATKQASEQARSVPDKVKRLLFGIKTKAQQEADRARRLHSEAQWRAEYNSQQGVFAKLLHIVKGPAKSPSQQHWDSAKAAGGVAYDHAANAAAEGYEAAKAAAEGVVAGGRSAARSAQGAGAAAADIGGRATETAKEGAGVASDYAKAGYDKSADVAAAAREKAEAAYQATGNVGAAAKDKAQAAADSARSASGSAGTEAEKAAHRAQEAAQRAKDTAYETAQKAQHRAQEAVHGVV